MSFLQPHEQPVRVEETHGFPSKWKYSAGWKPALRPFERSGRLTKEKRNSRLLSDCSIRIG
jgi:hypothetical protein